MFEIPSDVWSNLLDVFLGYGYVGAFLVSFIGSLLVFIPAPYLLPVALLSIQGQLEPTIIILSSALGAALAKTVIFRASYEGHRIIDEATRRRILPFMKLVSRFGWSAVFVAAATPIPDDVIYIPLGFARYNVKKFFIAALAGKIVITGIVTLGGRLFGTVLIAPFLESFNDWRLAIATVAVFLTLVVALIYIIVRTDWAQVLSHWFPWTTEDRK